MKKILQSLKNINYKVFIALLLVGLVPTIYTTVRVFLMGQLPGDYSYSIAGQLSWVSLIFEIVSEGTILPLFYFIGTAINDKKELTNRIKTGMLITFLIYLVLSILIIIFTNPLLELMAVSKDIIAESASYIRIEVVANIFYALVSFGLVVLTTMKKEIYLYYFMAIKLTLCVLLDTFLVSTLKCSANLGVNGIGISNIITNIVLLAGILIIFYKEGIKVFNKEKINFRWMKEFIKVGSISGLESFVRNFAYMVMISRMVNTVNEQGVYWIANNFIWGWLLLPISQLGELIKRETAKDQNAIKNNTLGYFGISIIVVLLWCVSIPIWKPFMVNVLQYSEVDKLLKLIFILLGFYVLYSLQNIFDSTFYGIGKTNYMLFESIITNSIYYGTAFILYKTGIWVPTLNSIALMFGIGMAFDSIVSLIAYIFLLKKHHINILYVESKKID